MGLLNTFQPSKVRIFMVISVVIVMMALLVAIVHFFILLPKQQEARLREENRITSHVLDTAARDGNVARAMNGYDQLISNTKDELEKRKWLLSKAIAALNNSEYEIAVSAAQSANDIQSDDNSLGILADIYDQQGDIKKAIEYYEKAAAVTDDAYYQNKANELKRGTNG